MCVHEVSALVAFEFVTIGEHFRFAVVVDAVVEGNVGFWEDEAEIDFFLFSFGD